MWPNPQETTDLVTITGEILHGKNLFFVYLWLKTCCNESLLKIVKWWTACHFWRAKDVATKSWNVAYLYKNIEKQAQLI